ncbi:primosomal protein N' [Propionibacterium australiense]|uniref:primosomal protein N' n=1 Tax=Propionibacterium australiense TaxID=119981 RepID=UPI001603D4DE|nr:primosomal protein N' [Propionibacterium australiense]
MTTTDALITASAPEPSPVPARRIARVALDVHLPHLDRFFDYSVPEAMAGEAVVGARVRARFAGRTVDGFIVELPQDSEVEKLTPLSKVVSTEPVLDAHQVRLIRVVADHYAGTFADVMRLAVPPRHAATEAAEQHPWPRPEPAHVPAGALDEAPGGPRFLDGLRQGRHLRAHWQVPPRFVTDRSGACDWRRGLVQACAATLEGGHSALVLVPDVRDVRRVREALTGCLGEGCVAELHSELGPAARYRNYLAASRGVARVLVGTRGAAYAPLHDLGLICLWDDGDDLHAEPRAPYPHARDIAALRASTQPCALLLASHARSSEVERWVESGWLAALASPPGVVRRGCALVRVAADSDEALRRDPLAGAVRIPRRAFETIRAGLASGPVLVQVPRSGYLEALSCGDCRTPVRCRTCNGPVRADRLPDGGRRLSCRWCGRVMASWQCPRCGSARLRAPMVGSRRTAEELGRAFPGVVLVDSSGQNPRESVGDTPALVVATPGAEPFPSAGYSAAVLLDAALLLGRADLRAGEEALRRWLAAVALVRPASEGGSVCLVGPAGDASVQALVRLDPAGFAARELAQRAEAGFPPAVAMCAVEGAERTVTGFARLADWPEQAEVLGRAQLPPDEPDAEPVWRLLVRVPRAAGGALAGSAKKALAVRSARKEPGAVRVRIDPVELS